MHIHRPEWLSLPLLRFYLVLAMTVPVLAYTVSSLHRWHTADSAPLIALDTLLAQAFVTHQLSTDNPLCVMSAEEECADAMFVHIKPQIWQQTATTAQDKYLELPETEQRRLLCQHQPDNSLHCLRLKAENTTLEKQLLFTLLFYGVLFIVFFIYTGNLFKDAAILRSSALNEIRHGQLPAFTLSTKSYLEPLAQSLQNMTARIAELTSFQTEIAETICHDIKTPVARMHFIAHQLEKKGEEQTSQQLVRNLAEIESNINEYLMLAQNQYTPDEITYESVNLSDFLHQMVELFSHDTQLTIEVVVASDFVITANTRLLHRAIANLLSNAMRYAGSRIKVSATGVDGYCHIGVHDDGKAISQNMSSRRPAEALHHSLGLSIVRRVCMQHNGHFNFTASSLGGHAATIVIPSGPVKK